jgi:hypothetical protein
MFKRILCTLAVFSFLLTSFAYAEGVLEKTGTAGAVIQGAKLGSKGLKELTKYGQRLVTDDNKTEEELEQQIKQYSQQENTKTNQLSNQQTTQTTQNKSILDNIASSVSDSADELKTIIVKKTEPVQDVVVGVGQLFSKVKDKVSGSDDVQEQSEITSGSKNKDKNGSDGDDDKIAENINVVTKNVIPEGNLANHIFSGKAGKLADTTTNRNLITELTNNKNNFLGVDKYGKSWYSKTLDDGTQLYGYTQNGIVKGAGVNSKPIDILKIQNLK